MVIAHVLTDLIKFLEVCYIGLFGVFFSSKKYNLFAQPGPRFRIFLYIYRQRKKCLLKLHKTIDQVWVPGGWSTYKTYFVEGLAQGINKSLFLAFVATDKARTNLPMEWIYCSFACFWGYAAILIPNCCKTGPLRPLLPPVLFARPPLPDHPKVLHCHPIWFYPFAEVIGRTTWLYPILHERASFFFSDTLYLYKLQWVCHQFLCRSELRWPSVLLHLPVSLQSKAFVLFVMLLKVSLTLKHCPNHQIFIGSDSLYLKGNIS